MRQVFCVKLVTDELTHFLEATEVREDGDGDMEVLRDDEVVAWYAQPMVEKWAMGPASDFLEDPAMRFCKARTWGDDIREMIDRGMPVGADEMGGIWYAVTPKNRSEETGGRSDDHR